MRIATLSWVLIVLCTLYSRANHIVGGEITLQHVSGYKYVLKMNIFRDINVAGPTVNPAIISFFDKAANTRIANFSVPLVSYTDISAESGSCANVTMNTRIMTYVDTITLDPAKYSGSEGFYAAFYTCCRNESTINISNPGNSGAVYYSEFPPIDTYVDSSPYFTNPTRNGYACLDAPFTYDFSAIDADGDSLVYAIAIPLMGSNDRQLTIAPAAPYSTIALANGYSLANLIHGSPPLGINSATGLLSFTATQTGKYVFSVTCKAYRAGVYLGSVTRDFELNVASCAKNVEPAIRLKDPITNATKQTNDTLLLNFKQGGCLSVLVVESQAGQKITVQAKGLNFTDELVIAPATMTIANANDTATVKVCIPPCTDVTGNLVRVRIIVENSNNCTIPVYDTLHVILKDSATVLVSPEIRFRLTSSPHFYLPGDTISADLSKAACFNVLYIDNLLKKHLSATVNGVNFSESFTAADTFFYNINSTILVDTALLPVCFPTCFKSGLQVLKLKVAVAAIVNSCPRFYYDTAFIYINNTGFRASPPNLPEVVFKDPSTGLLYTTGDTLSLDLMRPQCLGLLAYNASAGSSLVLTAKGVDFQEQVTALPTTTTVAVTTDTVKASICIPSCPRTNDSIITVKVNYVSEYNCSSTREDSSYLYVKNTGLYSKAPVVFTSLSVNEAEIMINKTLAFNVLAASDSPHLIYLSEKDAVNNSSFAPVSGYNHLSSVFSFTPSCKELRTTPYQITFIASDSTCKGILSDSVLVAVAVADTSYKVILPNVITPNDDHVNDYLEISHFPPDNCTGSFSQIEIYNRWGKMVYSDGDRDFHWLATDLPNGLYYYVVRFTNTDYKSWILVER